MLRSPASFFGAASVAVATSLILFGCASGANEPGTIAPRVAAPLPDFEGTAYELASHRELAEVAPEESPELHNVYQLGEHIVSGGEPHGEEAFRKLRARGIRTILSVDGKVPDAETAARYGMSYVHVPIQYSGITDEELARIAKTFREQEGPFYVHCFHGKHRGPAAAAVGRLVLDGVSREEALAEMRQWCGTSPNYEGLYRTIAKARIPAAEQTAAMEWDFPAASPLGGVASAMVEITRVSDHLALLAKNEWKPDPEHPDLDPLNEAAKMESLFARCMALPETADAPPDYRGWMQDSENEAVRLVERIRRVRDGRGDAASATASYQALRKTCKACHSVYRN